MTFVKDGGIAMRMMEISDRDRFVGWLCVVGD